MVVRIVKKMQLAIYCIIIEIIIGKSLFGTAKFFGGEGLSRFYVLGSVQLAIILRGFHNGVELVEFSDLEEKVVSWSKLEKLS